MGFTIRKQNEYVYFKKPRKQFFFEKKNQKTFV
jgi:hypothetical protein